MKSVNNEYTWLTILTMPRQCVHPSAPHPIPMRWTLLLRQFQLILEVKCWDEDEKYLDYTQWYVGVCRCADTEPELQINNWQIITLGRLWNRILQSCAVDLRKPVGSNGLLKRSQSVYLFFFPYTFGRRCTLSKIDAGRFRSELKFFLTVLRSETPSAPQSQITPEPRRDILLSWWIYIYITILAQGEGRLP